MEENEIKVLWHVFNAEGQKLRKNTKIMLRQVEEVLRKAGAKELISECDKGTITFSVCLKTMSSEAFEVQYQLRILTGEGQIRLEQKSVGTQSGSLKKLMLWYINRRNMELSGKSYYQRNPVCLKGKVVLRSAWKSDLLRRINYMNQIIEKDYTTLKALSCGEVPEFIKTQIMQEYREYEREMEHGVAV